MPYNTRGAARATARIAFSHQGVAAPLPLVTEHGEMPRRRSKFDPQPIYYVYVLFDWQGIPRYIGKGKDDRWLGHEKTPDPINQLKNEFIEQTWAVLGEIPKIKIQENIIESTAYAVEEALILAIGRIDKGTGPLTNLTDGGPGMPGTKLPTPLSPEKHAAWKEAISQSHRRRTPEQIRASSVLRAANYPEGYWRDKAIKQFRTNDFRRNSTMGAYRRTCCWKNVVDQRRQTKQTDKAKQSYS
jgi:hypothetical protein